MFFFALGEEKCCGDLSELSPLYYIFLKLVGDGCGPGMSLIRLGRKRLRLTHICKMFYRVDLE
jgi:hypothetical protein